MGGGGGMSVLCFKRIHLKIVYEVDLKSQWGQLGAQCRTPGER